MSGFGSVSPVRSTVECLEIVTKWIAGGTTVDATAVTGMQKGVATLAYEATGEMIATLYDWPGKFINAELLISTGGDTAPLVAQYVYDEVSASAKTIAFTIWDLATPSLATPAASAELTLIVRFQKTV